jgi:DNA helicase HerA-like ATPase
MASNSNAGRIGVWGRSGSGKSSYVKGWVRSKRRVIVFDPQEEYGGEGFDMILHAPANNNRAPRHRGGLDAVRAAMANDWKGFRLAYVPPSGKEPEALSGLSRLLMAAQEPFRMGKQFDPVTLVVEEMNLSFRNPSGVQIAPGFAEICSRGRHYGIEVLGVSQRVAEVATRFRGNCTETVVFAQKGPNDTKAASAELGLGPGPVAALKPLEFLHEKDGQISKGKVQFLRNKPTIKKL